ncbi:uncharacterized protein LOC142975387 [Anticarsia gemmatalis]|uniref:uncharacterized protein LOC142975387 n=1 Tax=Anticarsia gemmatalis TaxID=129554 RepID=UPI003F760FD6
MGARAWCWWVALLAGVAGARELDPAACAARFDVQRDKIIRTEESREMGARYLSELDVGARHECLRLCCETDSCDVFVYEEKGPGSCYLFNCGPPEDFRCKFTAHTNFSSGVLALSRRLAELQDQERLAHHEQELANLRSATSSTASTTAATTPAPAPPPRPTQPLDVDRPPAGHCSRYQFECRRGGECIAVYNACDGVAQCADGSDEAPELGCPPAPQPRAPAPPAALPLPPARTTPPPPALLKPLQEPETGGGEGLVASDSGPLSDRWPHRLAQAQPQHRYNDGASSHIFSHKGGLLQEPEGGAQFPPFEAPWPRRAWPAQPPPPGLEGLSGERGWSGGAYSRVEWPEPDPRRAWPVPPPRTEQEIPVYIPPKTMPEIPVVYSSQQQTLRDSPKKGFELLKKESTEPPPHIDNNNNDIDQREEVKPPPVENTTKKKVIKDKAVQSSKSSDDGVEKKPVSSAAAHQHYAADEHDGLSDHPPAAMMLLVIGVSLTALTMGMLACRARASRRRLRRGKSPFAHDADYLVNGMYL